jgi:hypothetical protein
MKEKNVKSNPPMAAKAASPPIPPLPVSSASQRRDSAFVAKQTKSMPRSGFPSVDPQGSEDERAKEDWFSRIFLQIPTWLMSALLHISLILVLALIPVREQIQNSLSLILGMEESSGPDEELTSFDVSSLSMGVETNDEVMPDLSTIETEFNANLVDVSNLNGNLEIAPMTLSASLSSRSGLMKDALLKAYGGTAETERAVAMGLEWLKRQQSKDGSWSLSGPYGEGGVNENRPAATALALLAFMGAGNTHKEGTFQLNVARGLEFLLSIQDEDGFFAAKATGIQQTYSQAQASIAICELYGMSGDDALRIPAERAVRWAIDAQSDTGGWRYRPRQDSDTSVTGWYVMALISARIAGLDVDSEVLERVHTFLDSVQRVSGDNRPNKDGDKYAYVAAAKDKDAMTAEGILCRMYLGWSTDDPRIVQGCEYLARGPITSDLGRRDYYYWYYATNALHHAGGSPWFRWNQEMRQVLPSLQNQTGRELGSWPPQGDPHGDAGGRLYSTVLAILCLEAYYRHMPLSEIARKP